MPSLGNSQESNVLRIAIGHSADIDQERAVGEAIELADEQEVELKGRGCAKVFRVVGMRQAHV